MPQETIHIDSDLCTLCGACIEVCVLGLIEAGDEAARINQPEFCMLCGHCKSVCPADAPVLPRLKADEFVPAPSPDHKPDPDGLLAFFRSRRSIRFYRNNAVEQEKLDRIIEAGRYAPTGGNRQFLRFSVVRTPDRVAEIRDLTLETLYRQGERVFRAVEKRRAENQPVSPALELTQIYALRWHQIYRMFKSEGRDMLFYDAPAIVVTHINPGASTHPGVEAGLAAMQMVLMAEASGLGTCFTGFLDFAVKESLELKAALGIKPHYDAPTSFVVGYPDRVFDRLVARNPARVNWL
ncbi:MAG: nitroreductase family protein [Proteobacteria bacterium]|nr:nitroreductase family protein [Pseudomonadota bacterium]